MAFPVTNVCERHEVVVPNERNAHQTCDAEDRVTSPQTPLTRQTMRSMTFAVFALGTCLQAVGAEGGGGTKGAHRHVFKVNLFENLKRKRESSVASAPQTSGEDHRKF